MIKDKSYCRGEAFAVIGLKYYVYAERQMLRPYAWPQNKSSRRPILNIQEIHSPLKYLGNFLLYPLTWWYSCLRSPISKTKETPTFPPFLKGDQGGIKMFQLLLT
ncbi:MAG: hypothetical protein DWB56_01015 [Candidatus Jettenia sp.]|nr:hypothetical protein [Candidatus Jettenia sp.]